MKAPRAKPRPEMMWWLLPMVLFINLAALGLLMIYSSLNLRPYTPPHDFSQSQTWRQTTFLMTSLLPTTASLFYLWPIFAWLRGLTNQEQSGAMTQPPLMVVEKAANVPVVLAAFSLLVWLVVDVLLVFRLQTTFEQITLGLWAHFIARPLVAGLVAATAVFFAAEYICRTYAWPVLLANTQIEGNQRLWKIRLIHRLFFLWLAISFLPLSTVAITALVRMDLLDVSADSPLFRVMAVIIFTGGSAALGGAGLAWLFACSVSRPLSALEGAMARLRAGDFTVREPVRSTDEIGTLAEGFNLMAERLSESYEALTRRNRELAEALDRIAFLESVKRGLDRFVPDTVRREIEANPDSPALQKRPEDVTVLFVDIEGYTRLSEELPRDALNDLVERYFSLYLSTIRAEGGDINETAGDGLMIIFRGTSPEQHAAAAVRTALAVREKTDVANREIQPPQSPIAVNIGVGSGVCDVGSTRLQGVAGERWTFTATGPVTNLAARLRDRATGGQILVNAETARRVNRQFRLRSLGPLVLKNISLPEAAWEVEANQEPGATS